MGKFSKYEKKYKTEWENLPVFKGWLSPAGPGSLNNARCKVCQVDLRAHKSDLLKHATTAKHKQKASLVTGPDLGVTPLR